MKTDKLIDALVADSGVRQTPLSRTLAIALAAGFASAGTLFYLTLGPRQDFADAMETWQFVVKLGLATLLAASGAFAAYRLAMPGRSNRPVFWALVLAPVALAVALVVEMVAMPISSWSARAMGTNAALCLVCIPLFALPVLSAAIYALREGAPKSPVVQGAVAGLLAGGAGALLYGLHCFDDSPMFVAIWYSAAIALVTAIGALLGRWFLRW